MAVSKIHVLEHEISTGIKDSIENICITNIARYKNPDRTNHVSAYQLCVRQRCRF
jgi:hypothetical protein